MTLAAIAMTMNCFGHHPFAGACFTLDQHCDLSTRGNPDLLLNLAHTRAESNQLIAGRRRVATGSDLRIFQSFGKNPLQIGTPNRFCSVKDLTNCGISSARSRKGGRCIVTTLSLYKRSSRNRPFILSASSDLFVAATT